MSGGQDAVHLPLLAGIGFGLAGPLVGLAGVLLTLGLFDTFVHHGPPATTFRVPPDFGRLRLVAREFLSPLVLQLAYVFGAVPALITGILAGMLARRMRSRACFLLICMAVGAAISGIGSRLVAGSLDFAVIAASAGAGTALVLCAPLWKLAQPRALPVLEQELS